MADQKLSALSSASNAAESDDLYLVTDTTTSPTSKKISFDNLQNSFTDISLDTAQFDTTMTGTTTEGQVAYNTDTGALEYATSGGFPIELGKMNTLPRRVKNETGATISKGTVVYISGVSGQDPLISKALATSDATSAFTIGVTGEDIADNAKGHVVTFGMVTGLNLSSYTDGDNVYLSGTVAGEFTSTKPSAPIHYVRVGIVTKATAGGELFVTVLNGFELEELHDVSIIGESDGDLLSYEASTGLWKNVTRPSVVGDFLKTDLSNTPLTGANLNFDAANNKLVSVDRLGITGQGKTLTIQSGGVQSGSTNQIGGTLELKSGIATGNQSSDITLHAATGSTSGTADRVPTQKMVIKGDTGNVGIGTATPSYKLDVSGTGRFTGALIASNLSGTNTGDQDGYYFGDGSDGYINFNGTEYPDFTTFDGIDTYTLTRDIYATSIDIGYGVTAYNLITAGYRIFCTETLTVGFNCYIKNNGGDASGRNAGTGALGGFFKAGTAGATGLSTATAGANGTVAPSVTNIVGGVGGRGACGRASNVTFEGLNMNNSTGLVQPTTALGGSRIVNHITSFLIPFIPSATNANIQLTPSAGGGAGAKSATGTSAVSGGGGGGGGFVYIAAKKIINSLGYIQANGGAGGDASGSGTANYGGGGGGGGGVLCIVTRKSESQNTLGNYEAKGGVGGLSVEGTNGNLPVAVADGTTTSTTAFTVKYLPTNVLNKNSLYIFTAVCVDGFVQGISGGDMTWFNVTYEDYNTIASPTRTLETWVGYWEAPQAVNVVDFPHLEIYMGGTPSSARFILDEIQNGDTLNTIYDGFASASSDSTTNLTVDLGYTPAPNNMVYSVFGRVGGSSPVVGTGNTVVNNQNALPYLYSEVSTARQTNNHVWTGATAAAGISIDLTQRGQMEQGSAGWDGKEIIHWV